MKKEKVSQSTIARELNLSRITVNKVLNNTGNVKESTRALVLKKAEALGYAGLAAYEWDNGGAFGAKSSKPEFEIAFVCHESYLNGSFWISIIKSLEKVLKENCCIMRIELVRQYDEENLIIPQMLNEKKPDGIIISGCYGTEYYKKLKSLGLPMVTYDISSELTGNNMICDVVQVENFMPVYELTQNLIEKGCKNIAFVGDANSCQSFNERYQGYKKAMEESFGLGKGDFVRLENFDYYYVPEKLYDFLKSEQEYDGFVCANDAIASNMFELTKPPYSLYDNMMLAGFDNIPEITAKLPDYSTVKFFADEIGEALGNQLLWRFNHKNYGYRTIRLMTKTYIRK